MHSEHLLLQFLYFGKVTTKIYIQCDLVKLLVIYENVFVVEVPIPPEFQIPLNPVFFSPELLEGMDRLVPSDLSKRDRPRKVMSNVCNLFVSAVSCTVAFKQLASVNGK